MNTKRELKEVVEELGGMKPYEIAEHLRNHNVKGVRDDWEHCAVAEYIHRETGVRVEVNLGHTCTRTGHRLITPLSVAHFVIQFDDGVFPDLVEEKVDA